MRHISFFKLTLISCFFFSTPIFAATRYVATTGTDSGTCTSSGSPCDTVQYAVDQSSSGDVIQIAAGTYSESDVDLAANKSLSFVGASAKTTIIDGADTDGIFKFSAFNGSNITVSWSHLTLSNGRFGVGGAVSFEEQGFARRVTLNFTDMLFEDNVATEYGGAIRFQGAKDVTFTRVTFKNNSQTPDVAAAGGGALQCIESDSLTLNNVIFSGNSSTANSGNYGGGAILTNNITTITIKNSTFVSNTAAQAGGIYAIDGSTITTSNSIFGNNSNGSCVVSGGAATFVSGGYNINSDATCNMNGTGDHSSTNPRLVAIADNGGEIPTVALLADSPAIDAGNNTTCLSTDARGETRPADGDGNSTATCDIGAYEIVCGDGVINALEECDGGDSNSDTTANACRTTCVAADCGDGVIDTGELCDDGNNSNTDACLNTCTTASCGDGFIQSGIEECDNAGANSNTTANACRTTCVAADCGDGVVDTGELCDDGNNSNTDVCLNTCTTASCGDGVIQSGIEECDNAGANSSTTANACRTTCVAADCGDGVVDTGEECDDGNNSNTDTCLNTCITASCGDGVIQSGIEECDNADANSGTTADACRATCVAAACGDGVVDTGEECDDGNSLNTDSCLNTCEGNICGNAEIEEGETCDDGNYAAGDGCTNICAFETFDELSASNPGIDFSALETGETLNLTAPDEPAISLSALRISNATSSCSCVWTLNPADFGSLSAANECTTDCSISGTTQANLELETTCADSVTTYNQTLLVTLENTGSTSSGGCQLNQTIIFKKNSPLFLFLFFWTAGVFFWNRFQAFRRP